MRTTFLLAIASLAAADTPFGAGDPLCLTANDLSIATGQPSLVLMSSGSVHAPVWSLTNISDIKASTPSLILDAKTGLLSNYYYHRGKGLLRRRVVDPRCIFEHPGNFRGRRQRQRGHL